MKKVLSLVLAIALITSLMVCCLPVLGAETSELTIITQQPKDATLSKPGSVTFTVGTITDAFGNLSTDDKNDVVSNIIETLTGTVAQSDFSAIKTFAGGTAGPAVPEIPANASVESLISLFSGLFGIELDTSIVTAITDVIGGLTGEGVSFDAGSIATLIGSLVGSISGDDATIDPAMVSTIVDAISGLVSGEGASFDADSIAALAGSLIGSVSGSDTAIDPAMISTIVDAVGGLISGEGASIDADSIAALVSGLVSSIGGSDTAIDPAIINTVVDTIGGLISGEGASFDADSIAALVSGLVGAIGGSDTAIDPAIIDTVVGAIGGLIGGEGVDLDADTISALIGSLVSSISGSDTAIDPALVNTIVDAIGGLVGGEGVNLDADTISALINSAIGAFGGTEVDPALVGTIVGAIGGLIGGEGVDLDPAAISAIINSLAEKIGLGVEMDPAVIEAVIGAIGDLGEKGFTLDADSIAAIIGMLLGGEDASGLIDLIKGLIGDKDSGEFDIGAIAGAISSAGYQWYVREGGKAVPVGQANDGNKYSGGNTKTLTVTRDTMPKTAESYSYFCTVSVLNYTFNSKDAVLTVSANGGSNSGSKTDGKDPFSDIANSGYHDYIVEAAKLGIIQGYEDGTYRPNNIVTRAQFITMLWRAVGSPEGSAALNFTDKATIASPYTKAVAWGVANEVIQGYEDGSFKPNQDISRAQMATFMYRYLKNVAGYVFKSADSLTFNDAGAIAPAYREAVNAIVTEGIMNGITATTFSPNTTANRGMAATVILRMYKLL